MRAQPGYISLSEAPTTLQHVAAPATRTVLGHVGDIVQGVGVSSTGEADVGHLVLVENPPCVEVAELQAEGGDGQLDVGGGRGETDSLAQHAVQLQVPVVTGPALANSVNALLGDVGPEQRISSTARQEGGGAATSSRSPGPSCWC